MPGIVGKPVETEIIVRHWRRRVIREHGFIENFLSVHSFVKIEVIEAL